LKLDLFILITLVYSDELHTDFSYTNFTVGLSYTDALDRLRVQLSIILFSQMSFNFANFCQKHTPENLKQTQMYRQPHLVYMFVLYRVKSSKDLYRMQ